MSIIMAFCGRLDWLAGEHACELPPRHLGACACECPACDGAEGEELERLAS